MEGPAPDDRGQEELERRAAEVEAAPDADLGRSETQEAGLFAAQYKAHSGPLPDQDWFAGVEAIHPGAAEVILRDFAEERQHQRHMQERAFGLDREVFSEFSHYQKTRLWIAGGLALFLAAGGLALILLDKAVYGFILLIGEITTLAGVFLIGKVIAGDDLDDLDDDELDRLLEEMEEEEADS
jgi:uncharacterized membrane protein